MSDREIMMSVQGSSFVDEAEDDNGSDPLFKKPYLPDSEFIPYVTDPPETLPAGATACPVPKCPAYGREFKPYWRINEHMKMKHGWSRKRLQKGNDRRLKGNQVTVRRRRRKELGDEASKENRPTPNGHVLLAPALSRTSSSSLSSLGSISPTASFESMDQNVGTLLDATSPASAATTFPPPPPRSTRDEEMVARIKQHIIELETPSAQPREEDIKSAEARAKMVSGLKSILEKDLIRVNTVMPAHQCQAITPLYKTLAARDRLQATTYRSPLTTASTWPLQRRDSAPGFQEGNLGRATFRVSPANPAGRRSSVMSLPHPDGASAKGMKLTLKLDPGSGLQPR